VTPFAYGWPVNEFYARNQPVVEATWTQWLFGAFELVGLHGRTLTAEFSDLVNERSSLGLDIGRVRSLYHWADKTIADPVLGIRLYQQMEQRAWGVLAPLAWHAPSLREIVNIVSRFTCLISGNGDFVVSPAEDKSVSSAHLALVYRPRAHTIPPNRHQSLAVTATVLGAIRSMTRRPDSVVALGLPASLDKVAVGRALECQTFDNGSHTELTLIINGELLDVPINGRDERLYSLVLNHAIARESEVNRYRGLSDDIGAFVRAEGFNRADIKHFCDQQGLHPRELQRTLAAQGLTFRQLRQKETRDMAVAMLLQTDHSISAIAAHLGYAESASFARACAAWFGRSPSELRKSGWLPQSTT